MRFTRILVFLLVATLIVPTVAAAKQKKAPSPGCPVVAVAAQAEPTKTVSRVVTHTQTEYRKYAHKVFQRDRVSWRAMKKIVRMERCQQSTKARRNVERLRDRLIEKRRVRHEAARFTPFGEWAIPAYIVMCESGGSWTAINEIGARGPYQFLGWPVPWPVRTAADRAAHHRMAAKLWAGGSGKSHWTQCL